MRHEVTDSNGRTVVLVVVVSSGGVAVVVVVVVPSQDKDQNHYPSSYALNRDATVNGKKKSNERHELASTRFAPSWAVKA
ncbi:hypothetical protein E2C01_091985 [Portunus trituberculatus]|uniref:Uncharacterized protein n=1 Tax=Portunus trituberculatus TaxID=210409 RepID=A0A5B7JIY9_PORTR|nr:hypothetical protein [Portunus trituberculatus]